MSLEKDRKMQEPTGAIKNTMDTLLGKLDEAIEDMEQGRVETIKEAWKEIDEV